MRSFGIILQQTYLQAVRSKSYVWMTIVLVFIGAFILALPSVMEKFSNKEESGNYVLITNDDFQMSQQQLDTFQSTHIFKLGDNSNVESYKEKIINNKLDGLFVLKNGLNPSSIQLDYYMEKDDPLLVQSMKAFVQNLYFQQIITEKNIDQDVANMLSAQIEPTMQPLRDTDAHSFLMIYLLIGIMFLAITTYGNNVATAITSEKSSRVMEVMITKISPVPMMFGKILGIGLASLTQLFIFFASTILMARMEIFKIKEGSIADTLMNILTVSYTIYFLLFFILGYFIYAALFAVIGSMASRPEELSSSTLPITIILMASLVVEMIFVIDHPEGLTAKITSYVPFTAPISLMVRIVNEVVSPLEIILSIGSMLVSIALFSLLAAKIYPKGILKTDQRLTFGQLIKNH
ncbi:ABC-2 type transport system permease protein [Oikeobacillus pervagus]|uniref:ABC-2 type transport system permease protein n=1 Tax=Oikeobacillus pervagus TaxID=1325931 RepID=A0AAJ1T0J1_9BACI|nr:ABC transporter permease [Oikeobacillus pervagus]MDQ0216379.1 ABC-2 type transport system permease protein [Oikeobacillus pervagus]